MVRMESVLSVVDNSGARRVKCIKVYGRAAGGAADTMSISLVRRASRIRKKMRIRQGGVYRAVIVEVRSRLKRLTGHVVRSFRNSAVLLKRKERKLPLANRIFAPVFIELRLAGFLKVITISKAAV